MRVVGARKPLASGVAPHSEVSHLPPRPGLALISRSYEGDETTAWERRDANGELYTVVERRHKGPPWEMYSNASFRSP